MKHPVTTTLSQELLDKVNEVRGGKSLFLFMREAAIEKCEKCGNAGRKSVIGHSQGSPPEGKGDQRPEDRRVRSEDKRFITIAGERFEVSDLIET